MSSDLKKKKNKHLTYIYYENTFAYLLFFIPRNNIIY